MNQFTTIIKKWFFLKPDKDAAREIDALNIKTIYHVSLIMCVVQVLTLIMYLFAHINDLGQWIVIGSICSVSFCILLCLAGFFGAGYFRRRMDNVDCHRGVSLFVGIFVCLLIVWGMAASSATLFSGKQIITFFIAEMIAVLFIRLKPPVTAVIVLSSYIIFYVAANLWIKSGMINIYNFMMMAFLSIAGAIIKYQLTLSYIEEKNKANQLNKSLEVIANHDSLTRLMNRYAFNQRIPGYIDTDICLVMIDIDRFKSFNDCYGHQTGDDVLRSFSDILLKHFDQEEVYRYGGDEFLIVCSGINAEGLKEKMTSVNEDFGQTHFDGVELPLSCSYGYKSGRPRSLEEFLRMLTVADEMLYEKKEQIKR